MAISHGWDVTTCAGPRAVGALLAEVRPQFFFSPPRMWEKLRASVLARSDGNVERAAADSDAVLRALGLDQVRVAVVGAAPCPPEVVAFWNALGVPLGETYGASETTGVAETAGTIDAEGWLHTGDIGVFDERGYLRIIDRIKEIIINAAGKKHVPGQYRGGIEEGDWPAGGEELTPTMKLKRRPIADKYAREIEKLYAL